MLSITKATVYIASGQVLNAAGSHKDTREEGITTLVTYIVLGCDAQVLARNSYIH